MRKILVNKEELINKLTDNKNNHVEIYNKAVKAYKLIALGQLEEQTKKVEEGALSVRFTLIEPINNGHEYDKVIEMFEWELDDKVTLEQDEFQNYVQDETWFAKNARNANLGISGSFSVGLSEGLYGSSRWGDL